MKNVDLVILLRIFVGISGCFSVLFGAWFAHGGQHLPDDVQIRLASALQYQFIHTLALLAAMVWYVNQGSRWLLAAGISFFLGILCFSGSLYVKTFFDLAIVGKITPFGGILLALGWLLLAFAGKTKL